MRGLLAFLFVFLLIFLAFFWLKSGYDKAVALDEQVKSAWAQVESQLKRRFDLIPNLVETVKGYAAHERKIFEDIALSRTRYFHAGGVKERMEASRDVEAALSRLLVLVERYPELKANESFLRLQDALEGTENRISVERKRYNEAVRELNTFTRTFFGRFFAKLAGVQPAPYFEAPEAERAKPEVRF